MRDLKKTYIANIIALSLVFAAVIGFMTILPRSRGRIDDEKRNVAEFPKFNAGDYFSGVYTDGIRKWFTDSVPRKADLKEAVQKIKSAFGISTDEKFINVKPPDDDKPPEGNVSDPLAELEK